MHIAMNTWGAHCYTVWHAEIVMTLLILYTYICVRIILNIVYIAVVIFIGQGNYQTSSSNFGELEFFNDKGQSHSYQPQLDHLKAKNTLFISLADYSERTFERMFSQESNYYDACMFPTI